jgi:hypothetical protein
LLPDSVESLLAIHTAEAVVPNVGRIAHDGGDGTDVNGVNVEEVGFTNNRCRGDGSRFARLDWVTLDCQ